ncbi:MAG: hypothetical protein KF810_12360 [Rhizobiaceae bacterium]|nr:hypothetical protein [Rhizobiaceae bacterium]
MLMKALNTPLLLDEEILAAAHRATQAIPPLWPLASSVAVNGVREGCAGKERLSHKNGEHNEGGPAQRTARRTLARRLLHGYSNRRCRL